MERMPVEIQTLYAELLERLSYLEARRSIGSLPGSFVTKVVNGIPYYYFQYSVPGGEKQQIYIGRKDKVLDKIVERYRAARKGFEEEVSGIERLCVLLRAGGAMTVDSPSARVLKALADGGVFRLNGVLIGTHAFLVLGNLLGVRWTGGSMRTQDIDIATETTISIAIPGLRADVPNILEALDMGFLPVPKLNPRHPSTSFMVRGKGLRVDLLTPLRGGHGKGPLWIPRLNAAAQPLRFLDFLITQPVRGVVIDGDGILVNVPEPARFALHKLIVAGERGVTMHTRREKDLRQAGQVFLALIEDHPQGLRIAWEEAKKRGKGWARRIREGASALRKIDPLVGERVSTFLSSLR